MRTLLLVEGESDCWTLWFACYHALGFPGASTYRKLELWHVENFDRVIIIQEPDAAGATFAAGLSARLLGFPAHHDNATTRLMARWFGVRDIGLGVLVFWVLLALYFTAHELVTPDWPGKLACLAGVTAGTAASAAT